MKIRTAKKIIAAVLNGEESRYRNQQIATANRRDNRTRDTRNANRWWRELMAEIGTAGRAYLIRKHMPADALRLYMQSEGSFLETGGKDKDE